MSKKREIMENKKDSFVFYRSFFEALGDLPDVNQLELFKAISNFSLNFKEPELNGISKTIFTLIRPQLAANHTKFKNGCKGGQFGHLGGRPKKEITPKKPLKNPKLTPNVNDNVNVNDNEDKKTKAKKAQDEMLKDEIKKLAKRSKKFKPPTLEEVTNYANEKMSLVDPKHFFEYFTEGNWVDSQGNPVKNWKQKFLTWHNRQQNKSTKQSRASGTNELLNDFINEK